MVPFDLVLGGWAVFLLVVALGGSWRAFDPAGFNMFVNTIDNGVFNGFLGVAPQPPPPAQGIIVGKLPGSQISGSVITEISMVITREWKLLVIWEV